jgi:A118 family predicted phage portal protein
MMNKMLLTVGDDGKVIVPQDVKQTYMQFFGDDATSDIHEYIKEFHPTLNTDALDKEMQNQLNILSDKVGLGTGYYKFDNTSVRTATEYIGEHNDFQRNVQKLSTALLESLQKMAIAILFVGKNILKMNVNDNAKVEVFTSDGVVESDSEKREQDRKDVEMGIMSKAEYRAKWYGETIEVAEEVVRGIQNDNLNNI